MNSRWTSLPCIWQSVEVDFTERAAGTPSLPLQDAETLPAQTLHPSAWWRRCGREACWSDPARTRSGKALRCNRPCYKRTVKNIKKSFALNTYSLFCKELDENAYRQSKQKYLPDIIFLARNTYFLENPLVAWQLKYLQHKIPCKMTNLIFYSFYSVTLSELNAAKCILFARLAVYTCFQSLC